MNAFNHHRRFTDAREKPLTERTTYDGLEVTPIRPLTGYRAHWSLYLMAFGLAVILTVVGVS